MRSAPWVVVLLVGCSDPSETGGGGAGQPVPVTGSSGAGTPSSGSGPGTADDAALVRASLPTRMACGATAAAAVEIRNTGTATWTRAAGYKLGAVDDSDPLYTADTRVWLGDDESVAPGASHVFGFTLTAPTTPGTYTTDWRMVHEGVGWFGPVAESDVVVSCAPGKRTGLVKLDDHSLLDDQGRFNALGTTLFWAAWAYKFDKDKLDKNLAFLAANGFDYIRALGVVGDYQAPDYWDGREIDWHWPDYDAVIAGVTDLAYDTYGLRVEWTLIGDGQVTVPATAERYALVDRFLAMSVGREQKIIHFEIANESWQNGFGGSDGVAELRALSQYMRGKTDILVAASAPPNVDDCSEFDAIYAGDVADLATVHFDRDTSKVDGSWRPVRQPWGYADCAGNLVGSNNEPIGPGSSVASENDPVRLVAAALATYVSNIPLYVFHTKAGVRGDTDLWDMPGATAFLPMKQKQIVPGGLASWSRKNAHWGDSPFKAYAGDAGGLYPNTMWPDLTEPTSGAVRAYGGVDQNDFFVVPFGILGSLVLEPRKDVAFDVIDPMTGNVVSQHALGAGESLTLSGAEVFVLRGKYQ
jgi:hypothetical protein